MPLRPLGLGDMYDAAFKIIRYNPAATVGSAVLVAAVAMAIPVLVTTTLSATLELPSMAPDASGTSREQLWASSRPWVRWSSAPSCSRSV